MIWKQIWKHKIHCILKTGIVRFLQFASQKMIVIVTTNSLNPDLPSNISTPFKLNFRKNEEVSCHLRLCSTLERPPPPTPPPPSPCLERRIRTRKYLRQTLQLFLQLPRMYARFFWQPFGWAAHPGQFALSSLHSL